MLKSRFLSCMLILALVFSGCSGDGTGASSTAAQKDDADSGAVSSESSVQPAESPSGKVKSEDLDASWDESSATKITLKVDSADLSGSGAAVSGSTVTINSAGTYVVSGSLADGQIIISASESALVRLVLNGADISNSATSPIYCQQADKLLIILADGSVNTVTDSESYVFPGADTDEPNAAIFSKADLTINGTGTLNVNANFNNGIGTKDDLIIVSGTFHVNAPNHAIRGRDSVTALDGSFTLNAGNDGIQANNDSADDKGWIELYGGSYDITSEHDGIQAETWLTVTGGAYSITSGGGQANAPQRATESRGGRMGGGMMPPQGRTQGEMPTLPQEGVPSDGEAPPLGEDPVEGQAPPQEGARSQRQATSQDNPGETQTIPSGDAANDDAPAASDPADMADTAASELAEDTVSDSFKGLKAGTDLSISGGSFVIDSADNALHANGNITVNGGEFTISTGDDGMHADVDLVVSGNPKIDILASYEGIEGATVTISDGSVDITATDDGINAAGGADGNDGGMFGADRFSSASGEYSINIEGGSVNIATGVDGLDSNGDILISGGAITFHMTTSSAAGGDGMLDKDGTLTITGGTILGAGGNGIVTMGRGSSDGSLTQPILQMFYTDTQTAGTLVEMKDASGNTIASFTAEQDFRCVILSAPGLTLEESYSVYTGGNKTLDLTFSDWITSLQDTGEAVSSMEGFGGFRGERPTAQNP